MKTPDKRHHNPGAPRKPAAKKHSVNFSLRLTESQAANLAANAEAAGADNRADYVTTRCCQPAVKLNTNCT
jgi:hypothetical protein